MFENIEMCANRIISVTNTRNSLTVQIELLMFDNYSYNCVHTNELWLI